MIHNDLRTELNMLTQILDDANRWRDLNGRLNNEIFTHIPTMLDIVREYGLLLCKTHGVDLLKEEK